MKPGDRVVALGMTGTCQSIHHDGVFVKFDPPNDLGLLLNASTVSSVSDPAGSHSVLGRDLLAREPELEQSRTSRGDPADPYVELRHDIEALRFGLVPHESLPALTIGYSQLRDWVVSRLPVSHGGRPTFSEVRGAFGNGKSHALRVVHHIARERNYLTAHVEVDGSRVTLSDPAKLLYAIWSTLDGPGERSSTPLYDLYEKAIQRRGGGINVAPRGRDRVQRAWEVIHHLMEYDTNGSQRALVEAVLSCDSSYTAQFVNRSLSDAGLYFDNLYPMVGRAVDERPYDFVESLIGHTFLAERAGFAGLVLTIDEFEVERRYSRHWDRVEALLNVLIGYFSGELLHDDAPIAIFVATVGETGDGSDAALDRVVEAVDGDIHELSPLSDDDLDELGLRVVRHYERAYGVGDGSAARVVSDVRRRLRRADFEESGLTRHWIKAILARLDSLHDPAPRYLTRD